MGEGVSWFERLKELIKIDIKLERLINIEIINNHSPNPVNSPDSVNHNEEEGRLSINYDKLTFVEKVQIKKIVRSAHNENITLLSDESQERIRDIKSKEEEPDAKSVLDFFRDKIPYDDYIALRSAIYIDKLAREGLGYREVYRLKGEVANRFGGRGYKICNLYSTGYFESMIKPIYEEYSQHGFFDKKKFLHKYNIIINEEAFAIFVPDIMEKDEVKSAIKMKIARNLKYGRNDVTIHTKGKYNIAKVREAMIDIEEEGEYPVIQKDIEETENSISVKLWF